MKSLNYALICSAAGILVGSAAQAAEIPVKKAAGAIQYVETCPAFGRGFIKLPGTDICMQMRGGLEVKFSFIDPRLSVKENGSSADPAKEVSNTTGWMIKIKPGFDFRSQTEYGTLRTFFAFKTEIDNGIHEDRKPILTGSNDIKIDKAYIEWAGFLIGLQNSQFEYFAHDDVILSLGADAKLTNMQFTYMWKLGNGVKATLGAEDVGDDLKATFSDISAPGDIALGPQRWAYAIVGSLTTEQQWGDAKLAALLNPIMTNNGSVLKHRETKWGWAVLGGVTLNLPQLAKKDQVLFQAIYCDGATVLCLDKAMTRMDDKGFVIGGLQRKDYDAFLVDDGAGGWKTETTKITALAGQFRHYWAPLWRTNISGSYAWVTTPDVARATNLSAGGLGNAHGWDAAVNLIWGESRKTAEIGAEVMYKSLHQDLPGAGTVGYTGAFDKDPSGWAVGTWIKRSW